MSAEPMNMKKNLAITVKVLSLQDIFAGKGKIFCNAAE